MYYIYQYVNKINGHMYIGFTNNLKRRYNDHSSSAHNPNNKDYNMAIHKALRKYGDNNFDFNVLEENIETIEEAKQKEQYWISYYDTYNNREHYNETPGGDMPGRNTVHLGEDHGMAKLTTDEVIFCRNEYAKGSRSRDIYEQFFKDKINYSGFLAMWHGATWKHIMPKTFLNNPHRGHYGAEDRDYLVPLFKESGLSIREFVKTPECYVGYGTFWRMLNEPEFYNNK